MNKPLKNQRVDYNEPHHRRYYLECDVKSAVEWLEQELNRMYKYRNNKNPFSLQTVKKKIDEAFEDVIK